MELSILTSKLQEISEELNANSSKILEKIETLSERVYNIEKIQLQMQSQSIKSYNLLKKLYLYSKRGQYS